MPMSVDTIFEAANIHFRIKIFIFFQNHKIASGGQNFYLNLAPSSI